MRAAIRAIALAGIAAGAAIGAVSRPACAQETGEQLVEAARCNACHLMSEPLLGPPYIAIAARHAARREVMIDVLALRIVNGGGGNWGIVPMVPNQWVSLDDARVMAQWILNLSPAP
ncbi:MAG TPA: cytochrome C [Gammaproteobacteria bacterium]|nr:cytochrome C [Gammaproteobacteria bacterium]